MHCGYVKLLSVHQQWLKFVRAYISVEHRSSKDNIEDRHVPATGFD